MRKPVIYSTLGTSGKVLVKKKFSKKFSQKQLLAFNASMQTSLIGLEACSGAHFLGHMPFS